MRFQQDMNKCESLLRPVLHLSALAVVIVVVQALSSDASAAPPQRCDERFAVVNIICQIVRVQYA